MVVWSVLLLKISLQVNSVLHMYSNYLGACVSRFGRVFIMKKNLKTIVLLQEYLMRNVKLAITMVNTEISMVITEIR